ncbi:hypothetical protein ABPG77_000313 [Micractinium sp. CCAP 211/92]
MQSSEKFRRQAGLLLASPEPLLSRASWREQALAVPFFALRSVQMRGAALLLIALLCAAAGPTPAVAADSAATKRRVVGGPGVVARKEDIPYIKCQVCELLAKNAWKQVKDMANAANASHPLKEEAVIERMERIGVAWRPEGEWIAGLDLVEEGDRLAVKEMGVVGNCLGECKTIQLAAEQIIGEHDTDIAEVLFARRKTRAQFSNWLCYELSGACRSKPPPLPRDRTPGPPFEPRQEGDQNVDAMLGGLADRGLHGNKLRDELLDKLGVGPKQEPDDDDMSTEALLKRAVKQAQLDDEAKASGSAAHGEEASWQPVHSDDPDMAEL